MGADRHRSEVPRRAEGVSLHDVSLTPSEGYVLSQIDGRTSVGDLELITGMPEEELHAALGRLATLGLVQSGPVVRPGRGALRPAILPDRPPTGPPDASRSPEPIVPRRSSPGASVESPAEGQRSAGRPDARRDSSPGPAAPPRAPDRRSPPQRAAATATLRPGGPPPPPLAPEPPPHAPVDAPPEPRAAPRPVATFTAEELRRIDTFLIRANSADFYRLLGVAPNVPRPQIRSAYFSLAKEFHPDAFYGRDLGPVKAKLERIFRQITRAFEVLSRAKSRKEYDRYLKGQSVVDGREEEERAWAEEEATSSASAPPAGPSAASPIAAGAAPAMPAPVVAVAAPAVSPPVAAVAAPVAGVPPDAPARLSSAPERAIEQSSAGAPAAAGPSASDAWRRQRAARQLVLAIRQGRSKPAGERRGGDFLAQAEVVAKDEEWGRVIALLEAATKLGLTATEQDAHDALLARANTQLVQISLGQARFAETTGDLEAALRHAEQACRFGPEVAEAWDLVARILLRLGRDLHRARDAAMRAIQAAPRVVSYRITMVRVYLAAGLPKNARREAEAGLEIERGDHQLRSLLDVAKAALD